MAMLEAPPGLTEWSGELAGPLTELFGGPPHISLLCPPKDVADDSVKLLVSDPRGRSRGVVLCSTLIDPEMVARSVQHARSARCALGEALKGSILEPLLEGRHRGLSYAVLPYCDSLGTSRVANKIQRLAIAPALFRWLRRSAEATMSAPAAEGVDREIAAALESLEGTQALPPRVRSAAETALERLNSGVWVPRRVLMHGDFWLGNVLFHSKRSREGRGKPWWDRFVVIDWGGSRLDGFPFWDLFRIAQSVGASDRRLAAEAAAQAGLLGCEPRDARSYLAAALGDLGLHLNHFPFENYARLADGVIGDADRVSPQG
jgi:hypothetical protein